MLRLGLPIALGGFFLDQATKWWVLNHVMNPPQVIPVTGFFNLVLGFNTGVSFGLFGQAPAWLLMAFTLAIVAGLLVWIHRSDSRLTASALGLVVGGALGNLLDRLRQGAVADFLIFLHWQLSLARLQPCRRGDCLWGRAFAGGERSGTRQNKGCMNRSPRQLSETIAAKFPEPAT